MAPKLSNIQRAELENVIINKLQGVEDVTDKEIARTIVLCSTRIIRTARSKILLLFPTPICAWARRSLYCYYTKETVPYRPEENLCLSLTAYSF